MSGRFLIYPAPVLELLIFNEDLLVGAEIDGKADTLRTSKSLPPVGILTEPPVPVASVKNIEIVTLLLVNGKPQDAVEEIMDLSDIGAWKKDNASGHFIRSFPQVEGIRGTWAAVS